MTETTAHTKSSKQKNSGGWNTKWVRNSNGSPLFGFPMVFYLNGMAAILTKTIGMVGTIAIAIAMTNHSKMEPLEIRTSKRSVYQCV